MMADIAKVKRNIQRMIDQGAPESDIDDYVASEGASLADLQAKTEPTPAGPTIGTGEDMAKSYGTGLAEGAIGLAAMPWDLDNLARRGAMPVANFIRDKLGLEPIPEEAQKEALKPGPLSSPAWIKRLEDNVTGPLHKPQTTEGEYARTFGNFTPGVFGPGGMVRNAISSGAAALTSETAAQLPGVKGSKLEPYVRGGAALVGGIAPAAAGRVITPFPAQAGRQAMVDTLEREGVTDLTAGQRTGSKALQRTEQQLGGEAAANMVNNQREQFTQAALRRVGEDAPRATPEVINHAFERIGNEFETLGARNTATIDPQFQRDVVGALREYGDLVPQASQAPIVMRTATDLIQTARLNGGTIPGRQYNAFRSRLARLARDSEADPQLSNVLSGLREALDDVMERSVSGADQAAWRDARRQYRNLMVVVPAATGAGENAAAGLISPPQLRNATVNQSRRAYARGQGDFAELARAGEGAMGLPNSSGTAENARAIQRVMQALGAVGGALAGGPIGAGAGTVAGSLAPDIVGRLIMSRAGQAYLANQLVARGVPQPTAARMLLELQLSQQPPEAVNRQ